MKGKLLFSTLGVVGICAISIIAYANAPSKVRGQETEPSAVTEYVPVETVIPEPTEAHATSEPTVEPTEKPQSKIGSMDWDADDSYLLAKIAMAEAENQDTEGKALVMLVVLNRVWDDEFPDTIEEVIYQPHQFSPISNGRFDEVEPDQDCWDALSLIQIEHWDESYGATYFESKSESTWHARNLDFLFKHGDHYFYKDKE